MDLVWAEARKHRAFRETWAAWLLGGLYLLLCLEQHSTIAHGTAVAVRQNWFSMQQDIHGYGANITVFLLCVGLPRLVCCEAEWGTERLVRTARRGCPDTWLAKTLYTALYCAAVVLAVGGASLLVHGGAFGFAGALSPVEPDWCIYFLNQSLPPLSNLGYCVLQYGFLYLGALYYAGFVLIMAALTRRAAVTICLCGAGYLVCIVYRLLSWDVSPAVEQGLDALYRFSAAGYLQQDSFAWKAAPGCGGLWSDVWKPVLLALAMIALEFSALWLLWRRKARR